MSEINEVTCVLPSEGRVTSQDLLKGLKSLVIEHDNGEYLLRLTRSNKLILTK